MDTKTLLSIADQLELLASRIRVALGSSDQKPFEIVGEPRSEEEVQSLVGSSTCLCCGEKIDGKAVRGCHEYCCRKIVNKGMEAKAVEYGYLLPPGKRGPKEKPLIPSMVAEAAADVAYQVEKAARAAREKKQKKG